ncbi:MauE/DoxX family redox-associated membrane protein [Sinomicrobium oceani]|uniref:MauE/DoxX family redox-associated membrane protein n=1 Tax=Sinomicrobium oceani TaxID=1150368 RepID=UPI00227B0789|nr:MauE/DoxX family redox-associated membrane protein [Sinomicrobium oceani]
MKNAVLMIPRFFVKHRNVIVEIICYLFILLFVYAAATKLADFQNFRIQLAKSPMLTEIAGFTSVIVPSLELIIALFLTIPRFRIVAMYASFCLMVMFTAYIYIIITYSPHIPCSCGGILENMGWSEHFYFNIAFVLLALLGILLLSGKGSSYNTEKAIHKFSLSHK